MATLRSTARLKQMQPVDLVYLAKVQESVPPVTDRSPIWIRHGRVVSGPPASSAERHPCFEIGIQLSGTGTELVGREQAVRGPGGLLLAAPGVPHWIEITEYPLDFITVFFLPSLLIELGAEGDGLQILRRFMEPQRINDRLVQLQPGIRTLLENKFREMADEFDHRRFGREVRLRTLLLEILVEFMRWERNTGVSIAGSKLPVEWQRVHTVLNYLQTNFKQIIYARDVAEVAGVNESQLNRLFRVALGTTWGKYLQQYRIHRATVLLSDPSRGVLETASEVGFETVSNFNALFREIMGLSPRQYRQKISDGVATEQVQTTNAPSRNATHKRAKNTKK
jgi:AraC-like DNA-binding protein